MKKQLANRTIAEASTKGGDGMWLVLIVHVGVEDLTCLVVLPSYIMSHYQMFWYMVLQIC